MHVRVKQNWRFPFIKYGDDLDVLLKGKGNVAVWRLENIIAANVPGFKKSRITLFVCICTYLVAGFYLIFWLRYWRHMTSFYWNV